jgi:hypothetical protein
MRHFFAEYTSTDFLEQPVPELKKLKPEFLGQAVPETKPPIGGNRLDRQITMQGYPIYAATANSQILSQAVRELAAAVPWGHHIRLLMKMKEPAARIYYLRAAAELGGPAMCC